MTRWVKFINALVLPFPQLPSVRVVSLDPRIGFFQMVGPWTIHFAHLSGYGPCSGLRECKLWANRATAMSFKVIPVKSPLLCPYRINDVDSMKMSDHVEFVAPQISDLAEPMAKRLLEGIPLTWGWTHHDMPSLRQLMQRSMEPFDSQPTSEVASSNEHYIHFWDTDGTSNQPMGSNLLALLTWITVLGSRSKRLPTLSVVSGVHYCV